MCFMSVIPIEAASAETVEMTPSLDSNVTQAQIVELYGNQVETSNAAPGVLLKNESNLYDQVDPDLDDGFYGFE